MSVAAVLCLLVSLQIMYVTPFWGRNDKSRAPFRLATPAVLSLALVRALLTLGASAVGLEVLALWRPLVVAEGWPLLHRGYVLDPPRYGPALAFLAALWLAWALVLLGRFSGEDAWGRAASAAAGTMHLRAALAVLTVVHFSTGSGAHTGFVPAVFSLLWSWGCFLVFVRQWTSYVPLARVNNGLCASCGYDLRGSPGACPECGAERASSRAG